MAGNTSARGYLAVAAAGVVLGAMAAAGWYGPQLGAANQAKAAAVERAGQLQGANERCAGDVDRANGAVAALRREAEERARHAASEVAAAAGRARMAEARAADLARRPPAKPDDLCGSLDELLTQAINERRDGR
ncbi:hypothetical protein [Cupriavidus malaysiensis]|uniref:DUF2514 family protein n=1 Tax=Cupriavidus malaysiensis TaxID=367825 RepID=A0ABN4TKE1_9BURK|nr:hypothetical protein [Cupriavidus malaysiensis]AOZ05975.1 hypothetical protein BKK80_09135 [Cupriavidus malaysiensis]